MAIQVNKTLRYQEGFVQGHGKKCSPDAQGFLIDRNVDQWD